MKSMKKLLSVLLATAMVFSMVVPAFADGQKITITGTDSTHQFTAYQIFAGSYDLVPRTITVDEGSVKGTFKVLEYEVDQETLHVIAVQNGDNYELHPVSRIGSKLADVSLTEAQKNALKEVTVDHLQISGWGKDVTLSGKLALYQRYRSSTATALLTNAEEIPTEFSQTVSGWTGLSSDEKLLKYYEASTEDHGLGLTPANDVAKYLREANDHDRAATAFAAFLMTESADYLATVAATPVPSNSTSVTITVPNDGYYLITDDHKTGTNDAESFAFSRYMLQVLGDVSLVTKGDAPEIIKKVFDNSVKVDADSAHDTKYETLKDFDLTTTVSANPVDNTKGFWNDTADYAVGDTVPFKLIGTLPNTLVGYTTYKYVMTDTLGSGLEILEGNGIRLGYTNLNDEVVSFTVPKKTPATTSNYYYELETKNLGLVDEYEVLTVTINDVKLATDIASYSKIIVEYDAVLNERAVIGTPGNLNSVKLTYSNNPNAGHEDETGTTPENYAVVFTYELDGTKLSKQDNRTLAGAEFKLRNAEGKWYKETEVSLTKDTETVKKILVSWVDDEEQATTKTTTGNGKFSFIGLDDHTTYRLYEVKSPFGFRQPTEPFKIELKSSLAHTQAYAPTEWTGTVEVVPENTVAGQIVPVETAAGSGIGDMNLFNSSLSQLPTTGGMGTTLFYVVGTAMVLGAALLLIAKKRSDEVEE